ncbi:DUF3488 and transglutaminase-like domain-containing protein [Sporolactobacillus sp. CPB3-1]|uniref:DUF3488 and transglutaminase-like domain-containing protein n=1 Tax=Sporolactobacillus mangiferae TaxID=2940498 RepID=A0ABT0M7B8_9BACL|nr:DUF3488 and transglutaminase-like domain-containing protein [Sporolactobacillus mangiferae]MCL1630729.1 DUF3488 and transglutaminase-like domain-containing protein [Sporolactobacillus mangiferae]
MNRSMMIQLMNAVMYGLAGLLLWLCSRPLVELTILNSKILLIVFIAIMLLFFYFKMPVWICFMTCGLLILYAMHFYFFTNDPLFGPVWLAQFTGSIVQSVGSVWRGEVVEASDLFSAFLFFILFGMILFAIRYWLKKGRLILFSLLAMFSAALIDTFTFYDGSRPIVLIAVVALLMLVFRKWQRFMVEGTEADEPKGHLPWLSVTGLAMAAILFAALLFPKPDSQWSGPSDYLSGFGFTLFQNGSFFSSGQRIGYDEDDSRLGGSLAMDQTPLFTASVSSDPGYWRVAHKDRYTGRGWSNDTPLYIQVPASGETISLLSLYEKNTKTNQQTAILRFDRSSPAILPFTGEPTHVAVAGRNLKVELSTGQLKTENEQKAASEHLVFAEPVYRKSQLRKTDVPPDSKAIRNRYLQLPSKLPNRVRALGQRLTSGHDNRYDQVRAVVDYLRSSRFRYATDQIPRPSRGQDYVDQFLFSTRVGYCDNFSTAMVVLLRSAGIPARWVKGFTAGEYQGQVQETVNGEKKSLNKYQITNADAHSWGEVYFPGSGWVPFEPTPSFNDPSQFASNASTNRGSGTDDVQQQSEDSASSQPDASSSRTQQQEKQSEQQSAGQSDVQQGKGQSTDEPQNTSHITINWTRAVQGLLVVFVAGMAAAWLTRRRWLRALYKRKIMNDPLGSSSDFQHTYQLLLRLLQLNGVRRKNSETLREFAMRVTEGRSRNALLLLTRQYERMLYLQDHTFTDQDAVRAKRQFRHLIVDSNRVSEHQESRRKAD